MCDNDDRIKIFDEPIEGNLADIARRVTRDLFEDRARDLGAFGFAGVEKRILEALREVARE